MTKTSIAYSAELTHRLIPGPAGRIHVVEQGAGPLVVLVHGFPESWYSWRHQLPALAAAGYRVAALDVRGYGRSSRPSAVSNYRMLELVDDVAAVVDGLGEESAVVVGHDWGVGIATTAALVHPATVRAVAHLSIPFTPLPGPPPAAMFEQMSFGGQEHYMSYFQTPGLAETEIEPDVREWLQGFYAALGADTQPGPDEASPMFVTKDGGTMLERFPSVRPAWLLPADLDVYAAEFERTGLTGALNRYRAMEHDWTDLGAYADKPVTQPSIFIGGKQDSVTMMLLDATKAFPVTMPGNQGVHLIDDCGHWVQQEKPDEVNTILIDWLRRLG
ncbi:Soluble epoxide hydrolase [Mycobacteroides salmoniphilum]|uniref:Soluble epoxide hydrolase n=1 Tax=Mycobacteroides salmoniphilum TaxID=404941 RepID=A0A4R8S1T1_9MYCO|nr:alpha/beta hydrolase [Mycobacteroides salmoniphilum]TDZ79975.1 Soluble epoxide hydrolase [Mycobacteroides salmoniphilum]